jgi:hypothetical protein
MTVAAAARALGISPRRVRALCAARRLMAEYVARGPVRGMWFVARGADGAPIRTMPRGTRRTQRE